MMLDTNLQQMCTAARIHFHFRVWQWRRGYSGPGNPKFLNNKSMFHVCGCFRSWVQKCTTRPFFWSSLQKICLGLHFLLARHYCMWH